MKVIAAGPAPSVQELAERPSKVALLAQALTALAEATEALERAVATNEQLEERLDAVEKVVRPREGGKQ